MSAASDLLKRLEAIDRYQARYVKAMEKGDDMTDKPVMRVMMTKPDYVAMAKDILAARQDVEVTDRELLEKMIEQASGMGLTVDWCRRQPFPAADEDPIFHFSPELAIAMVEGGHELRGLPDEETP
jgi:hypothetical protein